MSSKGPYEGKGGFAQRAADTEAQQEQAALLRQQRDLLQRQLSEQNLLLPHLLESQGLEAVRDEEGNITEYRLSEEGQSQRDVERRIRELTLADIEAQATLSPQEQEIRRLQTERQIAALKGELPVSPGLERSLGEQEQDIRARLFRDLGSGYETSTPGIETLAEFRQRGEELREASRRAEISVGEQIRLASEAGGAGGAASSLDITERLRQSRLGDIFGASQFYLPTAGAFGQSAQGFGQFGSQLFNRGMSAAQLRNQELSGYGQLVGAGLGAYAAIAASSGSSRLFKTNGSPVDSRAVLNAIKAIPVEAWQYRPAYGGTSHIGPYAEDVQVHFGNYVAPDGRMIDLISMNGVLMVAVKALLERIEQLEARNG